ncbi:energy-coupling factor transporter transmembrane component T family protein [Blautia parvula]|uniref:energy-coupling factor transporter transmembrane component T family protein n=1 Tax=Blautia parvula TaxID=2877527 RepID=UPI0036F3064C
MEIENKREDIYTSLDPRMKLLMLILFTTATYISRSTWVLLWDYIIIVALYMIRRLWRGAWRTGILFGSFLILEFLIGFIPHEGTKAALGLIIFFLERTSIFFVMGNWMATKLRISDFSTALQNMHFPKGAIITLAVVFRYLPTVSDEFRSIKNTMKLRGIGLTFKNIILHPIKTGEYAIVPLIIRSMKIADELAASAMTRGLDLETKRTSYREIRLRLKDFVAAGIVVIAVIGGIAVNSILQKGGI